MVGVHTLKVDMDDRRLQVNRGEDAIGSVTLKYVYWHCHLNIPMSNACSVQRRNKIPVVIF